MSGNPKGSKWRSTAQGERKKPRFNFTMTSEEHAVLARVAEEHGVPMSTAVALAFRWLSEHPEHAAKALRSK